MKQEKIIYALSAVIIAGAAFAGGMKYQQMRTRAFGNFGSGNGRMMIQSQDANQARGGMMQNGAGKGMGLRNGIGEIIEVGDKTFTIKTTDGGSRIVTLSDSTKISKSSDGSTSDLKTGTKVMVMGETNNDGSQTAQTIMINPGEGFGQINISK